MFQTKDEFYFYKIRVYIFVFIHKKASKILEKLTEKYRYQQKDVDKPKQTDNQPIYWVFPQFVNNLF